MPLIINDLDYMILERVDATSIKNVSRVMKSWRTYVANHQHKMRLIRVEFLTITFGESTEILTISSDHYGNSQPNGIQCPLNHLLKYTCTGKIQFSAKGTLSPRRRSEIDNWLIFIPEWWTRDMPKVVYDINDNIFCSFLYRLRNIETLMIRTHDTGVWYDEDIKKIVQSTQQVDLFYFFGRDRFFDMSVLDLIIEKSLIYPTQCPTVLGYSNSMRIEDLIRLLEKLNFPKNMEKHQILFDLFGGQDELLNWIRLNTSIGPSWNVLLAEKRLWQTAPGVSCDDERKFGHI